MNVSCLSLWFFMNGCLPLCLSMDVCLSSCRLCFSFDITLTACYFSMNLFLFGILFYGRVLNCLTVCYSMCLWMCVCSFAYKLVFVCVYVSIDKDVCLSFYMLFCAWTRCLWLRMNLCLPFCMSFYGRRRIRLCLLLCIYPCPKMAVICLRKCDCPCVCYCTDAYISSYLGGCIYELFSKRVLRSKYFTVWEPRSVSPHSIRLLAFDGHRRAFRQRLNSPEGRLYDEFRKNWWWIGKTWPPFRELDCRTIVE